MLPLYQYNFPVAVSQNTINKVFYLENRWCTQADITNITTRLKSGTIGQDSLCAILNEVKAIFCNGPYYIPKNSVSKHSVVVLPTAEGNNVFVSLNKAVAKAPEGWNIGAGFMFQLDKNLQVIDSDAAVRPIIEFRGELPDDPKKRILVERRMSFMQQFDGRPAFPKNFGYVRAGQSVSIFQERAIANLETYDRTEASLHELSSKLQLQFCQTMLEAFATLGDKHIRHNCLGSRNMLVFQENDQRVLKLSTFGLSVSLCSTKNKFRNFSWTPPEVRFCLELPYESASHNIWTLGLIAYKMKFGKFAPFQQSLQQIEEKSVEVSTKSPEFKELRNRYLSNCHKEVMAIQPIHANNVRDFKDFIFACLQPKPDERITIEKAKKVINDLLI